jgi:hypothetical protein
MFSVTSDLLIEPPASNNVHLKDAVSKVEDFLLDLALRIGDREPRGDSTLQRRETNDLGPCT